MNVSSHAHRLGLHWTEKRREVKGREEKRREENRREERFPTNILRVLFCTSCQSRILT